MCPGQTCLHRSSGKRAFPPKPPERRFLGPFIKDHRREAQRRLPAPLITRRGEPCGPPHAKALCVNVEKRRAGNYLNAEQLSIWKTKSLIFQKPVLPVFLGLRNVLKQTNEPNCFNFKKKLLKLDSVK